MGTPIPNQFYFLENYKNNNREKNASPVLLCLFVCFVALNPKSTAMVIAGRSVHLTTLFPGQA